MAQEGRVELAISDDTLNGTLRAPRDKSSFELCRRALDDMPSAASSRHFDKQALQPFDRFSDW
jgi:hypothetical protein